MRNSNNSITKTKIQNKNNLIKKQADFLQDILSKEDIHMPNKYMERCSTSAIITEMQSKRTMQCHLTPVRKALIKKKRNYKCWCGCDKKETVMHCQWKCKLTQPLGRAVQQFLKKLKVDLPYDLASQPTSGYVSKITEIRISKRYLHPMFTVALFIIAKIWKQPKFPSRDVW